ncbi:MAG: hypothetical protein J6K81_03105 [Rikenellaceae bacterium]|nr:hypothetical protein [Rikenellaceae bacterium]
MKKLFLLMICAVIYTELNAQTKTYSGQMIMPKETPIVWVRYDDYEPGKTKCDAEYSYYEKDGGRVKHGKFMYKFYGYTGSVYPCMIFGEYKDGQKNGTWLFASGSSIGIDSNGNISKENKRSSNFYVTIEYVNDVKNGPLEGVIRYGGPCKIKGTIENDKVVGDFSTEMEWLGHKAGILAKFNKEGNADGVWKISKLSGVEMYQTRTYSNGMLLKVEDYDASTGERKVLYEHNANSKFVTDLSSFKMIEKERLKKTFYKSEDNHYYTARKVSIFGEAMGLSKNLLGQGDGMEDLSNILGKVGFDCENLRKANSEAGDAPVFRYNQGKWAYFYVDADKIIVDYLKYNPNIHVDFVRLLDMLKAQINSLNPADYEMAEATVTSIERKVQYAISTANLVRDIRKNMKEACPNIGKKNIKKYHQHLVDNNDAEGLIKLFTEDYKQYMP